MSDGSKQIGLILATSFKQRMLGLFAGDTKEMEGKGLLICPCNDIHTFGLKREIDVAFFNRNSEVIYSEKAVKKNRIIVKSEASAVLERPHSKEPWFEVGDTIGLCVVDRI
jgi:hypothetical protein